MPVWSATPGFPVSIGGYFSRLQKKFLFPFYWAMDEHGLVNGGLGPDVVGATCFRTIRAHRPMLAERFLFPLTSIMTSMKRDGVAECKVMVEENGNARVVSFSSELQPAIEKYFDDEWNLTCGKMDYIAQVRLFKLGDPTYSGFALGTGSTPRRAFKDAEISAAKLGEKQICYRTDGGSRVKYQLFQLEEAGWLG